MTTVVDPWLQHQDSRQRFEEEHVFDRQGLYPVEIVTDSYIERTRLFLRGVGRRDAVRVIGSEPEFAECADVSKVRFVNVTGYQYLGPHLRRRPGLKLVQDEYQLLDGTTVARWDQPTSSHIHHESFHLHPLLIQVN